MKHLKIHEEVRLVEGYLRSVAYDLPRGTFHFLPKELSLFIKENDRAPLKVLLKDGLFSSYYDMLLENEIVFVEDGSLMDNFPALSLEWRSPFLVKNVIVDILQFDLKMIARQLDYMNLLNVKHVHYTIKKMLRPDDLDRFFALFQGSTLHTVDFLVNDGTKEQIMRFIDACKKYPRISRVFVDAEMDIVVEQGEDALSVLNVDYGKGSNIRLSNFMINVPVFMEAQQHHVYFNEKLFIAENGDLKNSPGSELVVGNINAIESFNQLVSILSSEELKQYWKVSKDACEVCRHCEFRYMCTDNRIPVRLKNGGYYFGAECNYNPFIAKWKDEPGYRTLKGSGIDINGSGLEINRKVYDHVIKELWDL